MKQKYNPTRALGIALRQLYPGAFTSYQGIVFRVTSETNDLLSGVTEDSIKTEKAEDALYEYPELTEKAFATIRKEVMRDTGVLLPDTERRKLRIKVPGKVDLRLDEKLENVFCQNHNCGTMWK